MRQITEGGVSKSNCHPQGQQSLLINVSSWNPKFRWCAFWRWHSMGQPFVLLAGKVLMLTSLGWKFSTSSRSFGCQQNLDVIGRVRWLRTLTLESDQTDLSSNLICITVSVSSCCIANDPKFSNKATNIYLAHKFANWLSSSALDTVWPIFTGLAINLPSVARLWYGCSWMASAGRTEFTWLYPPAR